MLRRRHSRTSHTRQQRIRMDRVTRVSRRCIATAGCCWHGAETLHLTGDARQARRLNFVARLRGLGLDREHRKCSDYEKIERFACQSRWSIAAASMHHDEVPANNQCRTLRRSRSFLATRNEARWTLSTDTPGSCRSRRMRTDEVSGRDLLDQHCFQQHTSLSCGQDSIDTSDPAPGHAMLCLFSRDLRHVRA